MLYIAHGGGGACAGRYVRTFVVVETDPGQGGASMCQHVHKQVPLLFVWVIMRACWCILVSRRPASCHKGGC